MPKTGAAISVSWGDDVEVSIRLTPQHWAGIKAGKTLRIRGKGYRYESEFFWDYWASVEDWTDRSWSRMGKKGALASMVG